MSSNNQAAFPQWNGHAITSEPLYLRGGMSLRDYFAAKAMVGILSSNAKNWPSETPESLASCCYQTADAMLAEREKVYEVNE